MAAVLDMAIPVFGLILAGFLAGRPPFFGPDASRTFSTFIFYLALPSLLFRAMAKGGLPRPEELDILFTYYSALLIVAGLGCVLAAALFRSDLAESSTLAMGGAFSNLMLVGVPLVLPAFGEEGLRQLLLIVTFHAATLVGLATFLVEVRRAAGKGNPLRIAGRTVAALLRNPIIVAILSGIAVGTLGVAMPRPVDRMMEMLSAAAVPCSLFAVGGSLVGLQVKGMLGRTALMVVLKMALLPLLVWGLGHYVFSLDPLQLGVAVTCASLPIGLNVFIFAQRYSIQVQSVASATVISTILSTLTTTAAIAWFHPT